MKYFVYFLFKNNSVIYVGFTKNIKDRINQHNNRIVFDSYLIYDSFDNKYNAMTCEKICINVLSNFSNNNLQNKELIRLECNIKSVRFIVKEENQIYFPEQIKYLDLIKNTGRRKGYIAEQIGTTKTNLSQYINGKRKMPEKIKEKLTEYLIKVKV